MITVDEYEVQQYLEDHNSECAATGDVEIPITPEIVKAAADACLGAAEDAAYDAMTDFICDLTGG